MSFQFISTVCHLECSFCCNLWIMLICSSVARCMTQKHPPKHPPSAGRASVGWRYGPSKTKPLSPSSTNMTLKLDPWTNPQANISKQALSSAFTRGMGDGNHASVTKSCSSSSWPKCYVEINHPGNQDGKKPLMLNHPPSSKTATVLKTETLIKKKHSSTGYARTCLYFFGSLCALCVLLVAGYTGNLSLRLRNLARELLKVKPHFWLLDTGTSASFIIHGAQRTSAMSHLPNAKIGFTSLLYVHTHRARTNTQHWLSCPSAFNLAARKSGSRWCF